MNKKNESNDENNKKYICPCCGSRLESFTSKCPYCLNEIRDIKVSKELEKFISGLDKDISNKKLSKYIINYPVPNSKENLLEFMILATSNIDVKNDDEDDIIIVDAWIKKMNQIYEKSKLSLKGSDLEKIETLYKNKINEIKIKKYKTILYIIFGVLCMFLLYIMLENFAVGLSLFFLVLSISFYAYSVINNKSNNIFKINISKKVVYCLCILLFILSIGFGIKGIFFNDRIFSKPENDYYDSDTTKYEVNVDIDFVHNIFFNKYNVDVIVYDKEDRLYHGTDKSLKYYLPNGKHKITFTGDGMKETVTLNVKGNTYVKYKVVCHEDEIVVQEIDSKYNED